MKDSSCLMTWGCCGTGELQQLCHPLRGGRHNQLFLMKERSWGIFFLDSVLQMCLSWCRILIPSRSCVASWNQLALWLLWLCVLNLPPDVFWIHLWWQMSPLRCCVHCCLHLSVSRTVTAKITRSCLVGSSKMITQSCAEWGAGWTSVQDKMCFLPT